MSDTPPNFDPVARLYRTMERIVFGSALDNTRRHHIGSLPNKGRVLLLGDGVGRFLQAALHRHPSLEFVSVDASKSMLALAQRHIKERDVDRVSLVHSDATDFLHHGNADGFDAVVTHFFLDCFDSDGLTVLVPKIAAQLRTGSPWLISEFDTPTGTGLSSILGRLLLPTMYGFFRLATRLPANRLPDWRLALSTEGLVCESQHASPTGLLVSEVWNTKPTRSSGVRSAS